LLRAEAAVVESGPAELIVIAQERPGVISQRQVELLRREMPLAGVVVLAGSWCEGELRTGRPLAGVQRLYWYEFPIWWRRQMGRRTAGLCPDWATSFDRGVQRTLGNAECGVISSPNRGSGVVLLAASHWDVADALGDVLQRAGFSTVWERPTRPSADVRGVVAGIWEGGQLDAGEEARLGAFCDRLRRDGAPVIALLDFPRRDRVDRALELGASGVLGKPWETGALVGAIQRFGAQRDEGQKATRRAA
jgi:hypothetical protein